MAKGAKTGGREKGTPNHATAAKAAAVAASGQTPLDFMLDIMRNETTDIDKRLDAAKAAAPYVHPKLASVELKGDEDHPLRTITRIERVIVDANGGRTDHSARDLSREGQS